MRQGTNTGKHPFTFKGQESVATSPIINPLFQEAIRACGRTRQLVMQACGQFRIEGKSQTDCQASFTQTFKSEFPGYNFTDPKSNPDHQRHVYDNIRKAISDYFKQFKPAVVKTVAATTAPAVAQQVPPSHLRIAEAPKTNDSPKLAAQMGKEELEELVLNMAQQDTAWAKSLAIKLMNIC